MNRRVELQWRLALLLLIAVVLLGILAVTARALGSGAAGAWVHGLIDADSRAGYKVRLERWVGGWEQRGSSTTNISGAWGIGAPMTGRYRARLEEMPAGAKMIGARYPGGINGQMDAANRAVEFDVPATGLVGDIVFIIASAPTATPVIPTNTPIAPLTTTPWPTFPVPTTLYPPTVDPTATATLVPTPTPTPTAAPCLEFQQFSWLQRRAVIDNAVLPHNRQLEDKLDWDNDPTLIFGLRDQLLGMPGSRRFEVTVGGVTLTARAFCNGILTMRPVLREECISYGIITWDGTQNWMEQ